MPFFFFFFFFFFFSKLAARALDVLGDVRLDFFHATDFGSSEHSKEKVYEVYILSGLTSWSAVSVGTGATSYKRFVQVSLIFSAFSVTLWNFCECIQIM